MAIFDGADGTRLTYHQAGEGRPLICVPGGPMQASAYLGDLGGLSAHRWLVLLDLRGTGASAIPADSATYRCDRQVDDVEALRMHLGLDRIDLLGHSAGGALALLYAARHPDRVGRLVLLNPSPRVVGLEITDLDRRRVAELRRGEAWFQDAFAALERIWSGQATAADWTAIAPFTYGRWDAVSQAHLAREASQTKADAAAIYYSAGALDPEATSASLARLGAPVLLVAGEYDVALPPRVPPSMPACSVRASWPCSRAAATIPGWMIRVVGADLGGVLGLIAQRPVRRFRRQMIEQARLIMAWWV
jgi:pimeloyl-ACP methyl ester carboxylesterase